MSIAPEKKFARLHRTATRSTCSYRNPWVKAVGACCFATLFVYPMYLMYASSQREQGQAGAALSPKDLQLRQQVSAQGSAAQEPFEQNARVLPEKIKVSQPAVALLYSERDCQGQALEVRGESYDTCDRSFDGGGEVRDTIKSMKVEGAGHFDLWTGCGKRGTFWGTVLAQDNCVPIYTWPGLGHLEFHNSTVPFEFFTKVTKNPQDVPVAKAKKELPGLSYNVIYSCESSTYFGYQVYASYYSFLTSHQGNAAYTRLLTASEPDDLAAMIPTYTAKRHSYVKRYSPLNKPDVLDKWFKSPWAPKEEVIVVIDPDNWLFLTMQPYVDRVKKGHGLATPAYFAGMGQSASRLYKLFCPRDASGNELPACNAPLDLAAVPYFVHRDDLAVIAPLWTKYTLAMKEKLENDPSSMNEWKSMGISWCAEMFGYIFAAAEAGVRHELVRGRAWMPNEYVPGWQWHNPEGKDFSHFGNQVWCKCNYTASDIIPWPLPPNVDFQSRVTLETLHYSKERFGELPDSKFRKKAVNSGAYYEQYP